MRDLLSLRINKRLASYEPGTIVKVRHDNGIPHDRYWRDRIRDSEFDDCVTVIKSAEKKKPANDKIDKEV